MTGEEVESQYQNLFVKLSIRLVRITFTFVREKSGCFKLLMTAATMLTMVKYMHSVIWYYKRS